MGWLITLGILTLLAILPLGVLVRYNASGPLVKVILGPVRLTLIPGKKKPKKEKKPKDKKEKKEKKPEPPKEPELPKEPKQVGKSTPDTPADGKPDGEKGGSLLDFLPLVTELFSFLGDFRRKLRINHLEVKLILAGDDPCDLAVNYGRAWAALGNLLPKLDQWFVIKKRDIEVECDFTASETVIIAGFELTITLGRLLAAVVRFALRALIQFLKINKKRKGGTKQ